MRSTSPGPRALRPDGDGDAMMAKEQGGNAAARRFPSRGGRELTLDPAQPLVMGIVNLTPDSFSDGGRFAGPEAAVKAALALEADGASILDLGAESTRPGSDYVSSDEELRRLLPVLKALRPRTQAALSIDTRKAKVAQACLELGADWVNDVSGLRSDPELAAVLRDFDCPLVLMHMRGDPKTMQDSPSYEDVLSEVRAELGQRLEVALAAGIDQRRVILDPGLGFAKRYEDNLELLRGLAALHSLGCPILLGASRKSFLGRALGGESSPPPPAERDIATLASIAIGHRAGVAVHRVHQVRYASEFLRTLVALEGHKH